ncbi:hypothetical protein BGZ65_005480, partial [Modicella reniformis]
MPTAPATPTLPQVSFVNLYSEDPWKKRQRVRIQQACSECRRQKIKCDGQKPCKSCKKSDRNCVYNAAGNHASTSRDDEHHQIFFQDDHASSSSTASSAVSPSADQHQGDSSQRASPAHPHSPHPYSKQPSHQHVVGHRHHHVQHNNQHLSKDSGPADHSKPSPLRKDSKHDRKNHDSEEGKNKLQVKDIGKYGVPLDEWQKQNDSSFSSTRKL